MPTDIVIRPLRGTWAGARLPLALFAVLAAACIPTFLFTPEGRLNWCLEVGPGLIGCAVLAATYRRFPLTPMIYVLVLAHCLILVYGGYYSYAKAPLGEWMRDAFGLHRNHYDRIGHLAFGFFPALAIRELLWRTSPLRPGAWLNFVVLCTVQATAAWWEFVEWWSALVLDPAGGDKFLGTQGDVWDAQWDMFLALVGAAASLSLLGRLHRRAVERLLSSPPAPAPA